MANFNYYDLIIYAIRNSSSARQLATTLGSRRWRDDLPPRYQRRRPYFRGNNSPLVVNWGSSIHPRWLEDSRLKLNPIILNHGDRVKRAIDKLAFFQEVSKANAGVPLLKWTTDIGVAKRWLGKGFRVVCRLNLKGSGGEGIVIASTEAELVTAPLYTRYFPKTHEFRVHVFNGRVIDLTQKKLRITDNVSSDSNSTRVRSLDNGWVHAHVGIELPESSSVQMGAACVGVVNYLGLNFGAVDVLATLAPENTDGVRDLIKFVICEVNTAPGLKNAKTIVAYTEAIMRVKNGEKLVSIKEATNA